MWSLKNVVTVAGKIMGKPFDFLATEKSVIRSIDSMDRVSPENGLFKGIQRTGGEGNAGGWNLLRIRVILAGVISVKLVKKASRSPRNLHLGFA